MELRKFDAYTRITSIEKERIAAFLFTHLDNYGDSKDKILKAIEYTTKDRYGLGGYVFLALNEVKEIIGSVVVNKTGMEGYIPENILVYIAIHKDYRGKGLGKKLMQYTIDNCPGDIALHVERDNPAFFLYKKMGFTNPYLEMRLKR